MRRHLLSLFLAGLTSLSGFAVETNAPTIGDVPPPLLLSEMVQGPTAKPTWESLKGKVVVLEFWNTRCAPCIAAIPHLNELATEFEQKPVVFLSVSDDNPSYLKQFLKRKPMKSWLALDEFSEPTRTAFGVLGIPRTFIIAPSGRIAAITHPASLKKEHLEEILAGKPSSIAAPKQASTAESETISVSNLPPASVEVSITGPVPQPEGAYNSLSWKIPESVFVAENATLPSALAAFFNISPHLVVEEARLPEDLYSLKAAGPPDAMADVKEQLAEVFKAKFNLVLQPEVRETEIYSATVYATNAPRMKPADKPGGGGGKPGGFYLRGSPMKSILSFLDDALNKPVANDTGLTGRWTADLQWELSESEQLLARLDGRLRMLVATQPEKVLADKLSDDQRKAISAEDLKLLQAVLAKPPESQFEPDPAKVIKAAREQLGLELKLVKRPMPIVRIRPVASP